VCSATDTGPSSALGIVDALAGACDRVAPGDDHDAGRQLVSFYGRILFGTDSERVLDEARRSDAYGTTYAQAEAALAKDSRSEIQGFCKTATPLRHDR
jgi:hypothetical protein